MEEKANIAEYTTLNSEMSQCPCSSYLNGFSDNWDYDSKSGCATIRPNLGGGHGKVSAYLLAIFRVFLINQMKEKGKTT